MQYVKERNIKNTKIKDVYVVFVINKRFVRWEIFDTLSTLQDVFNILKTKYDINKCIIEIGSVSIQNRRFDNENLSKILVRENIGTIYVFTKTITVLKNE